MKSRLYTLLKFLGIGLAVLVLLILSATYFLSERFDDEVKSFANEHLNTELNFSKSRLSFFNHFPSLTLTLYNFSLKGAAPFQQDTLLASKEIALGVDLWSVFKGDMIVNKVFLTDARINVKVDASGKANYDIYTSSDTSRVSPSDSSDDLSLQIEKLMIENSSIDYDDQSMPMQFSAKGFNYSGKGDLSKSIFDLASQANIESFDFNYDHQYYFVSKKIQGDLVTKINTQSLSFFFERNDLRINDLPIHFNGMFAFLKKGYRMDFNISAQSTELKDIISAMPQDYIHWMEQTDVRGKASVGVRLFGDYISDTDTLPSLVMNVDVQGGYVAYQQAPFPIQDLFLHLDARVPHFNLDSTEVNMDSLSFGIEKGFCKASLKTKGLDNPTIAANIHTEIDLGKIQRAIGLKAFDMRGQYGLKLQAAGRWVREQNPASVQPDTIVSSIPSFSVQSYLKNGYFKNRQTAQAVDHLSFNLEASCKDHQYRNTSVSLKNIEATFLGNFIKGYVAINGGPQLFVDGKLQSKIQLASLQKIYPVDSLQLQGNLRANIAARGVLDIDKKIFPTTHATIDLVNGMIQSKYYPKPIEKINIQASLHSTKGALRQTSLAIQPVSFLFEGHPFMLHASLQNFENIHYDIASQGILDLGHLCKVFASDAFDVTGQIKTHLALKGNEQDLKEARYEKLHNTGTLEMKDIVMQSEYFPYPFHVDNGVFIFVQDSIRLQSIRVGYGHSDLTFNGSVANILPYYLRDEPLRGRFTLDSKYLDVNQFMAAVPAPNASNETHVPATPSGVVVVPPNLDVNVFTNVGKIKFGTMNISDAHASLSMQQGTLSIHKAGFVMIQAPVEMTATYYSMSPTRAYFDYRIHAKSFDIRRAYNEVPLFREMVSSAATAQGIISLDYQLKGKLNAGMSPVFPSLEGEGVLSVQKAKIKGFKLLTAISKATEKDSLNNPSVSNIQIKTSIKNNLITLAPLKMKIAGFRPRIQGQSSFDGHINFKCRLGLPPLGIIGIPFSITGTQSNPIVKMKRGKNNQPLTETSDDEAEE